MAARSRSSLASRARPRTSTEVAPETDVAERKEALDDDVDAILDEIDDVLETNAEDFVQVVRPEGRPVSSTVPAGRRRPAGVVPDARHLVASPTSWPRRRPTCCPARRAAAAGARRRPGAARHDDRRGDLRRRRRHGRRPPRHDGQPHRPARHREGLPGRRVLRASASPAPPGSRSRWSGCSRSSSSTTRRSRARTLSLDGKANRLAAMIRGNLGHGHAGPRRRAAVRRLRPRPTGQGRIFSYDVTGGRYEEHGFHSVGSGSLFARGSLKKLYRAGPRRRRAPCARRGRGAVRRRRRRLRHRRPRPHPPDLPGRAGDHRRRRPPAARRRGRRDRRPRSSPAA